MTRDTTFNFSAGPSVLPEPVLRKAQEELLNYRGTGMSVMEMSHRSKAFLDIFDSTKAKLKAALQVPDGYEILFLQGGATTQFAAIPMNLLAGGSADYAVTGRFSGLAAKEAAKYGTVNLAADTTATGHDRIPTQGELKLSADAKYFYYCSNNTIYGTEWHYVPETEATLVCDMSSDILSRPVDVAKYGLIYAGAQKNLAPAGLTIVIVDKKLAGQELPYTPEIMRYSVMLKTDSMLNTPPCWCIYMLGLTLDWIQVNGGTAGMEAAALERSGMLYEFLGNSSLFKAHAQPGSQSRMNVTFRTGDEALDALFCKGAAERGLVNVKGHKTAGGMRASMYNAMPMEGTVALLRYMKEFEVEHHA